MSHEFDTSAAIFDRSDLRILSAAYARALAILRETRFLDAEAKTELARLVFHLGRERLLEGTSLRYQGAGESIAGEASSFLDQLDHVPLVA